MNYIDGDVEISKDFLRQEDLRAWKALPRPEPIKEKLEERPKSPWSFNKSVFATFA